jgi:cytochrome d ubiquinol oxidase subunit I
MTAELGRQPWLVYGVLRTEHGFSSTVSSGNTLFSLLGFMGLYMVLGILFLFLVTREISHGPGTEPVPSGIGAGSEVGNTASPHGSQEEGR